MPIYEYLCSACGNHCDELQNISDPPLTECPACRKTTLQRTISLPGFRLKGTGWYETDFKTKKKPTTDNNTTTDGSSSNQTSNTSDKTTSNTTTGDSSP